MEILPQRGICSLDLEFSVAGNQGFEKTCNLSGPLYKCEDTGPVWEMVKSVLQTPTLGAWS